MQSTRALLNSGRIRYGFGVFLILITSLFSYVICIEFSCHVLWHFLSLINMTSYIQPLTFCLTVWLALFLNAMATNGWQVFFSRLLKKTRFTIGHKSL